LLGHVICYGLGTRGSGHLISPRLLSFFSFRFLYLELPIAQVVAI
jgi:hypothetical protein